MYKTPVFVIKNQFETQDSDLQQLYYICLKEHHMKLSGIILFIVVFTQTLMPCMDAHPGDLLQTAIMSQTSHHDSHHTDSDCCSPFCTCQCCNTVFYVTDFLTTSFYTEPVALCREQAVLFESAPPVDLLVPPKA